MCWGEIMFFLFFEFQESCQVQYLSTLKHAQMFFISLFLGLTWGKGNAVLLFEIKSNTHSKTSWFFLSKKLGSMNFSHFEKVSNPFLVAVSGTGTCPSPHISRPPSCACPGGCLHARLKAALCKLVAQYCRTSAMLLKLEKAAQNRKPFESFGSCSFSTIGASIP